MNTLQDFITLIKHSPFVMKGKTSYCETFLTFDIETTRIPDTDYSVMYTWQVSCSAKIGNEYPVYVGREWCEFRKFLDDIANYLSAVESRIVIFVHNLNYEMCYLTNFYKIENALWLSPWNTLSFTTHYGVIEWRDSYKLFNCSLATATKGLPHEKKSGEDFDYSKSRYHFTPITEQETQYCINDTVGLVECIIKRFSDFGINGADTIATVPLTSTGYVRRETRNRKGKTPIKGMKIDETTYTLLKQAFRGGNTHANSYYTGKVLENVVSYDRSSSYPDCLVNKRFPITEFKSDTFSPKKNLAYLITIRYRNITLKPSVPVPYIPYDKCTEIENSPYNDNGRVVKADTLTMTITDIDYRIIEKQYTYTDYEIITCMSAEYGYLPKFFVETVNKYYIGKTALKGVTGSEVEYAKSKELLNSLYGMCVTDIHKETIEFSYDKECFTHSQGDEMKPVLPYQWGVWCTAHARKCLQDGIDMCGNAFVYCDTDSIKAVKDLLPPDFESKIEQFNNICRKCSIEHGGTATTPKGVVKYMGVFEYEETYKEFVTLGAKKYCYRDETGLHITVSGVGKGCVYQLDNDIHNFTEGFIFHNCKLTPERIFLHGKTDTVTVTDYLGNTGTVTLTDCETLVETDYSTGLEDDYKVYVELVQGL